MLTRKPQKGDVVVWRDRTGAVTSRGTVNRIDGRLAWCTWDSGPADPFIWEFADGLNQLAEFDAPMTTNAGSIAKDREAGCSNAVPTLTDGETQNTHEVPLPAPPETT